MKKIMDRIRNLGNVNPVVVDGDESTGGFHPDKSVSAHNQSEYPESIVRSYAHSGNNTSHVDSAVPEGYNQFSVDRSANRRIVGGRWLLDVQQEYTAVHPVANPVVSHASTEPMAFRNMSLAASKEDLRGVVREVNADENKRLPAGLYRSPDNQPVWNPKDVVDGALQRVPAAQLPSFLDRAAHPLSIVYQAQEGLVQGVPTEPEQESLQAALTYGALAVAQTVEDFNLPRPTQE